MGRYRKFVKQVEEEAVNLGRNPQDIHLIAVSKGRTLDEILSLYEDGCRAFGESRVQDALPKIEEAPNDINWHFIGRLQKNKVRKVVGKFALIHSVDSLPLAEKISEVSLEMGIVTPILYQVRDGELPSELFHLPGILLQGLMVLAPNASDDKLIRTSFRNLRMVAKKHHLSTLSMGMSGDYLIAIQEGATHLRIGRALFDSN